MQNGRRKTVIFSKLNIDGFEEEEIYNTNEKKYT